MNLGLRIALIEDHCMFRDVLRRACERDFGCRVVAESDRMAGALAAIERSDPDLVLLDLHLPDADGLDLLELMRGGPRHRRILVLSSRCDGRTVYRLERAAISGFIDKGSQTVEMLGHALEAVAAGKSYYSPAFAAARAARRADTRSFDKLLTERELTILACLGDCLDDREIAQKLGITADTVAKHRFNLLRKLDLATTPQLMRYARAQGFAGAAPR